MDIVDSIIRFESGETSPTETLDLFSELISTRQIAGLQGYYHRYAADLIRAGYLSPTGEILQDWDDES
jgi:hypothetical protein